MDRAINWKLEIFGSHGINPHRYPALLAMITAGKLKSERLVGKRISLDEVPEALTKMDQFEGVRVTVIDQF